MSIALHNHKKYITAVLRMTQMEFVLVAFWLVIYYALALAGLPIAAALFRTFPDRGATFALPASLVVVTVITYWLGQFSFTNATIVVAVVVLAALSMALTRYDLELDLGGYTEAMVVFTVAFCFLVVVRAIDPAIIATGGEKFLDFGVLQSLMRTPKLPPEDMWFAGKSIQYYYGGHLIAAILTKLTGTLPRYSYNLALSGFYGMLITSAYGLASAIADRQGIPRRFAGIAAGFFVGFAGNVYTPLRLVAGSFPQWLLKAIAKPLEMDPSAIPISPTDFHYWDASRVMVGTINEFPFFAYLNGDLHAHMMGQPFLLFVAALGYAIYRSDTKWRRLLVFVALPPVVGFISTVSFWSFPTALGVVWLSLVFAEGHPATLVPHGERLLQIGERSRLADELIRITVSLLIVVAVGGLAFVWAAPFILNVLLGAAGARGLGFLPDRSNAVELLIVHGIFLCLFALYLGMNARWKDRDTALVVIFGLLLGLQSWKAGAAALLLVAPLLVGGWLLLRSDADLGFETVLLVAGAGLVLLVEFVYVRDNAISGRFNTVFKVYMQLWVLWGVAAGVALTRLVAAAIPAETAPGRDGTSKPNLTRRATGGRGLCDASRTGRIRVRRVLPGGARDDGQPDPSSGRPDARRVGVRPNVPPRRSRSDRMARREKGTTAHRVRTRKALRLGESSVIAHRRSDHRRLVSRADLSRERCLPGSKERCRVDLLPDHDVENPCEATRTIRRRIHILRPARAGALRSDIVRTLPRNPPSVSLRVGGNLPRQWDGYRTAGRENELVERETRVPAVHTRLRFHFVHPCE